MKDDEIRLLIRKDSMTFLDGEDFAKQVYEDTEIGVSVHVHIPTNGFPATEYGEVEVTYFWRGEVFSDPETLRLCMLRDLEIRTIMETRETAYREKENIDGNKDKE